MPSVGECEISHPDRHHDWRGDCPGINAVIRAVAKKAILKYEMEVIGFKDGDEGASTKWAVLWLNQ